MCVKLEKVSKRSETPKYLIIQDTLMCIKISQCLSKDGPLGVS